MECMFQECNNGMILFQILSICVLLFGLYLVLRIVTLINLKIKESRLTQQKLKEDLNIYD